MGVSNYGQVREGPPSYVTPPQLTILKHTFAPESRFATEPIAASERGGEPATRVVAQTVMAVSEKAKSSAPKTIVGVSWYFAMRTRNGEALFNVPFLTQVEIASQQTKTFKGEMERMPWARPRAVTVDELKNQPEQTPMQQRVVITCMIFSDGTFSALNDASKSDCERLQASPEIRKKIEKR